MTTVAIERDIAPAPSLEPALEGSAEAPGGGGPEEPSRTDALVLRFIDWGRKHPHSLYHRTLHKVAHAWFRLGLSRFDSDMMITATGRKSGLPRRAVVSGIVVGDRLYAMNPFGNRAHWYRNLTVNPLVTVQRLGRTWAARAARLTDRDEAMALYAALADESGMNWLLRSQGITASAESFADHIDELCFVRFDETDEPGPPPLPSDLVWIWPVAGMAGLLGWFVRRRVRSALAAAAFTVVELLTLKRAWEEPKA